MHCGINYFDVCFIDGNHDDYDVVREDFEICHKVIKDNRFIIWDDYKHDIIIWNDISCRNYSR